ncbi:unnamed protein product, partial [Rotaria sordida]
QSYENCIQLINDYNISSSNSSISFYLDKSNLDYNCA